MIIDSLHACGRYSSLSDRLSEAFAYILNNDLRTLPEGRHSIRGEEIFITVTSSPMRTRQEARPEAHDRYIDIQLPLDGEETYGWASRPDMQRPCAPFDTDRDIVFFEDEPSAYVTLHPGQFVLFFPTDAHAPLIGDGTVRKCIVKVMI